MNVFSVSPLGSDNRTPAEQGFRFAEQNTLLRETYERGDRLMMRFILAHCVVAVCLASVYQTWLTTLAAAIPAALLLFVGVKLLPRSFLTRCLAGISLQAFAALHIYQMHGMAEMHFFFFTAFTMMLVYQDWRSMRVCALLGIGQQILFAALTAAGLPLYFFPAVPVNNAALSFHFGIALTEIAICGCWAARMQKVTLENAFQQREILRYQQAHAEQILRTRENSELLESQKHELEKYVSQLQELAHRDGLTGLRNHRAFQEKLQEEYDRAVRYDTPLSLILLDVDKFKDYNDTYGHPAGDKVLKAVAQALEATARTSDFAARYGGEEFVILLGNTDRAGATASAERFRKAIESAEWKERPVTASFGVASLAVTTLNKAHLVSQADEALYAAKQAGRNCVKHFATCPPALRAA